MHTILRVFLLFLSVGIFLPSVTVGAETVRFLSSQLAPVEEAKKMREVILKDAPVNTEFIPFDDREFFHRLIRQQGDKTRQIGLIGGVHGEFTIYKKDGLLRPLNDLLKALAPNRLLPAYLELGRLDTEHQYFIPWMQATYVMVANRQALGYLPPGADINALTYDQFSQWGARMAKETGSPRIGFPVGRSGLMHRFLQGYLYPSHTGGTVRGFRSANAVKMWQSFRALWPSVHPRSLTANSMDKPLLTGEIWVAWDHTARVMAALEAQPDDFIVFPAPAGPKGRGFMVVMAGLAIPAGKMDMGPATQLIAYLTKPETQLRTLSATGFFPVSGEIPDGDLAPGIRLAKQGIQRQNESSDALPTLLPVGLGEMSAEFNNAYSLAFSQIVLRNRPIEGVLEKQAARLADILAKMKAPCWPPDAASQGPCPLE